MERAGDRGAMSSDRNGRGRGAWGKSGRRTRGNARRRLMIYGSTGFTGRLIAQRAAEIGLAPVLAGRDEDRVRRQAELLGTSWRTVSLDSIGALTEALSDIEAVVHAAGPFVDTAPPMLEACLRAETHYLDVSGELPVFREALGRDSEAVRAGVMLMPGAAWSVVATDCLAAYVAERLPRAKYLRLGMTQSPLYSRGTARSAFRLVSSEVVIRRNGRLIPVPIGRMERNFDYGEGERTSMALSWPDALSAYHTTAIPNIEAYMEVGAAARVLAPLTARIGEAFQLPILRSVLRLGAAALPEGPAEAARKLAQPVIVAEAEDAWRRVSRARLRTADGYDFTALAAVAIAERVIAGEFEPGFQTPGRVYGADFVLSIEGTTRIELDLRADETAPGMSLPQLIV
jgi:short subunit dehydrogenase-like uncharacterized protein